MTTTVIVQTHDWPAEVLAFPLNNREPIEGGEWKMIGEVEPNSSGRFYVTSTSDLLVRELPSAAELAAAADSGEVD